MYVVGGLYAVMLLPTRTSGGHISGGIPLA